MTATMRATTTSKLRVCGVTLGHNRVLAHNPTVHQNTVVEWKDWEDGWGQTANTMDWDGWYNSIMVQNGWTCFNDDEAGVDDEANLDTPLLTHINDVKDSLEDLDLPLDNLPIG